MSVYKGFLAVSALLLTLTAGCTRQDDERAKQKLHSAGQELKRDLNDVSREVKKDAHEAGRELKKGTNELKKEIHSK